MHTIVALESDLVVHHPPTTPRPPPLLLSCTMPDIHVHATASVNRVDTFPCHFLHGLSTSKQHSECQGLLRQTASLAWSVSRAEDPGFDSRLCRWDFSGSRHTSDFKLGTSVATLPGAWRYRDTSMSLGR